MKLEFSSKATRMLKRNLKHRCDDHLHQNGCFFFFFFYYCLWPLYCYPFLLGIDRWYTSQDLKSQQHLSEASKRAMSIDYCREQGSNAVMRWLRGTPIDVNYDFRRWRKHQADNKVVAPSTVIDSYCNIQLIIHLMFDKAFSRDNQWPRWPINPYVFFPNSAS